MGKRILSVFTILFFCATMSAVAQSGEAKIAVLDIQQVMSAAPELEEIQKKLNSFIEQKQKQFEKRTDEFQQELKEYDKNKPKSQEEQEKREKELAKMEQELGIFQQNIQAEIQNYRQQLLSPLYSEIDSAIAAVAENRGLDFVLNKSTSRGEEIVRYVGVERLDITDEIIQRITSN